MIKPLRIDVGLPRAIKLTGIEVSVPTYTCLGCGAKHTTIYAWPRRRLGNDWADRDLLWLAPPCGKCDTYERIEACEQWLMTSVFTPQVPPKMRRVVWDQVMK